MLRFPGNSGKSGRRARTRRASLVLLMATGFAVTSGHARPVFDFNDPALAGGVTVPLNFPAAQNATTFQFQSNGVAFRFESLSGRPLGSFGILAFGFGGAGGVRLTIDPPVPAIRFLGVELHGRPNGTFVGTLGSETVMTSTSTGFFGAADVGGITAVDLSRGVFVLTEMTFVVPAPPPIGIPAPGVRAEVLAGTGHSPIVETAGDPGTAEAMDSGRPEPVHSRARAEVRSAEPALRRVQSVSAACPGQFVPATATSEARVVQHFTSSLVQGFPTPSGVDIDIGLDFDGALGVAIIPVSVACPGGCPEQRNVGSGDIAASVSAQLFAHTASAPRVTVFNESATLDYDLALDGRFGPTSGWSAPGASPSGPSSPIRPSRPPTSMSCSVPAGPPRPGWTSSISVPGFWPFLSAIPLP